MRLNLYKLHFLSPHFSTQPNKSVFSSLHFSNLLTKYTWGKNKIFFIPSLFHPLPIFYHSNFPSSQPNELLLSKCQIFESILGNAPPHFFKKTINIL